MSEATIPVQAPPPRRLGERLWPSALASLTSRVRELLRGWSLDVGLALLAPLVVINQLSPLG